jgi:hypothetical protein
MRSVSGTRVAARVENAAWLRFQRKGRVVADEDRVRLRVYRGKGKLTPAEVRGVFAKLNEELKDPASEASKEVEELGFQVRDLKLEHEPPAFVAEAFIITFVVGPFVAGAAGAAGKLVFDKVIKPRIGRVSDNGVTKAESIAEEDVKGND